MNSALRVGARRYTTHMGIKGVSWQLILHYQWSWWWWTTHLLTHEADGQARAKQGRTAPASFNSGNLGRKFGLWSTAISHTVVHNNTFCSKKNSHPSSSMQCTMKTNDWKGDHDWEFYLFICVWSIKHAVYDEDPWTQKDTIIGKFSMSLNMHAASYDVLKTKQRERSWS